MSVFKMKGIPYTVANQLIVACAAQAIILTNGGLLLIRPLGIAFSEVKSANTFIQENKCETNVCKMAAILSRPQCVDIYKEKNKR